MTTVELDFGLARCAASTPDKTAIRDSRTVLSYAELASRSDQLALGMQAAGLSRGDIILVSLPNYAEFLVIMFASLKLGVVLACVNLQFKAFEIHEVLRLTGQPKLAFMSNFDQINVVQTNFPALRVIQIAEADENLCALDDLLITGSAELVGCSADDTMVVAFTSGSTGSPKGVELTVRNIAAPMRGVIERYRLTSDDVSLVPVPFCQTYGIYGILFSIVTGGTIVTASRFDAKDSLRLIRRHRVTMQYCVPTMYARQIDAWNGAKRKPDISSLRTGMIAGAPSVADYMAWFEAKAGCRLLTTYGMTESSCMICGDYEDSLEDRYGTLGRPCRDITISIRDENGEPVPDGESGEICCQSEGVMKGYYRSPELTAQVIDDDGWLHTGDLGRMDADGYVHFVGRQKDMIIRGGYSVFPAEVEKVFLSHPAVDYAIALGYSGGELGEKIAVFLRMGDARVLDAEAMKEYAARLISKFKVPDRIIFVTEFPKLENGKVDKHILATWLE